jgi:hypothetical protein
MYEIAHGMRSGIVGEVPQGVSLPPLAKDLCSLGSGARSPAQTPEPESMRPNLVGCHSDAFALPPELKDTLRAGNEKPEFVCRQA